MLTLRSISGVRVAPFRAAPKANVAVRVPAPVLQHTRLSNASEVMGLQIVAPQTGCKWTMMRHGNKVKHLGRPADQRKALIRSLVTEVIRHGQITTTKVKAQVIKRYVDKMITLAKRGDLHARRQALAFIYDKTLVQNLFKAAPDRYKDRNGGYCRVLSIPVLRRGDAAELATIELV